MNKKSDLPDYPRSRALLIGCAHYQDDFYPQIPAAHNSLSRFRDLLTASELCGWPQDRITIIENPVDVVDLTKRVVRICRETEDVLLLYFVGHGNITPSGELCLALSDTEVSFPDITGLEYRRVKQALLDSPARVKVSIIDCCYSGRAIEALADASATAADSTDTRGVYTMTASDHTAHVVPLAQQENVCTSFTGELIDLVRNGVPGAPEMLSLGALYVELRRRLAAHGLPQPNQRGTDTVDRFTFTRNAHVLHRFFREPWGPAIVRSNLAHPSRMSILAEHRRSVEKIDALPVNEEVCVESIKYGEGPQRRKVDQGNLRTLPALFRLSDFLVDIEDRVSSTLAQQRKVFTNEEINAFASLTKLPTNPLDIIGFPHEILVSGRRGDPSFQISLHLITDMAYMQGVDSTVDPRFSLVCLLDNGGIAAFLAEDSSSGQRIVRSPHGAVGLLVAVASDGTEGIYRSRYTCVVRTGIRYPDDSWVSRRTGLPFLTTGLDDEPRFAFQSRQPNGLGWDVFVADLDGERMIDLTFKDYDGYSGFSWPKGEEAAKWLDSHRFQYVTMRRGRMQLAEAGDWIGNGTPLQGR